MKEKLEAAQKDVASTTQYEKWQKSLVKYVESCLHPRTIVKPPPNLAGMGSAKTRKQNAEKAKCRFRLCTKAIRSQQLSEAIKYGTMGFHYIEPWGNPAMPFTEGYDKHMTF